MPVAPRRLLSTCSSSPMDFPTTPPKRRRLRLSVSDEETEKFAIAKSTQDRCIVDGLSASSKQDLITSDKLPLVAPAFVFETPSRKEHMSEEDERKQRMIVCDDVRDIVQGLFMADSVSEHLDDSVLFRAQTMACYFVQVFFMFTSLSRENLPVVAEAAVSLALRRGGIEVDRLLTGPRNTLRELSGDERGQLPVSENKRDSVPCVESRMHDYLVQADCLSSNGFELPSKEFDSMIDRFLQGLPASRDFQASPAIVIDVVSRIKVAQAARCFFADGMMGVGAVLLSPHVVAAGALVLAAQHILRPAGVEISTDEMFSMVAEAATPANNCMHITHSELRRSAEECDSTSRLRKKLSLDGSLMLQSG